MGGVVEKPLHVRVADALGCTPRQDTPSGRWYCGDGEDGPDCSFCRPGGDGWVPSFDTDWSATGPLIEKHGMSVRLTPHPQDPALPWVAWAGATDVTGDFERGPTPLIAICNLLLALSKAGKLQAA